MTKRCAAALGAASAHRRFRNSSCVELLHNLRAGQPRADRPQPGGPAGVHDADRLSARPAGLCRGSRHPAEVYAGRAGTGITRRHRHQAGRAGCCGRWFTRVSAKTNRRPKSAARCRTGSSPLPPLGRNRHRPALVSTKPDVLHAPTVEDAVDHQGQSFNTRLPTRPVAAVENDRSSIVLRQSFRSI
jgi:hypothetical protein